MLAGVGGGWGRGSKSSSEPEQARPPETVSVPCIHTVYSDNSGIAVMAHQSGSDPPTYIENIYKKKKFFGVSPRPTGGMSPK